MTAQEATQPTQVRAITTWFTQPGWTTAHELHLYDGNHPWLTFCGYYLDEPQQAPDHMPRCGNCTRITNGPRP